MRDGGHCSLLATTFVQQTAPGEIKDLVAFANSQSVMVKWKKPIKYLECLKAYSVCWRQINTTSEHCDSIMPMSYPRYIVSGLKPCTEYTISVASVGGNITGNATSIDVYTGPKAVDNLEAWQTGAQTVLLKWSESSCALLYSVCWGAWDGLGSHSCVNVSSSKATVFGLQDLDSGTKYTVIVKAISRVGSVSDLAVLILENSCPVSNLSVTEHSEKSVRLFWDVPETCRGRIIRFEVCWDMVSFDKQDCSHVPSKSSGFELFHLEQCKWYNISVNAVYIDGVKSENRSIMQFTGVKSEEDPSPLNFSEPLVKGGMIHLSWTLSDDNDSCVTYTSVCWTTSSEPAKGWCELVPSYKYDLKIKDTNLCSVYNFTASVLTNDHHSIEQTISIDTGPGAPRNVKGESPSPGTLLVKWEPPLPGEDCVDHYVIRTDWHQPVLDNISADTFEYLFENEPLCEFVYYEVLAYTVEGVPSDSSVVYAHAGLGAPGEVRNLTAVSIESHSVHLQWSVPENDYRCLKKYSICWHETFEERETCGLQKSVPYPLYTILELEACTEYLINVSSQGEKIRGNASQLLITTGPEPVGQVSVVEFSWPVTLKWKASLCARSYSVCWGKWEGRGNHSCLTTSSTNITIADLSEASPEVGYTVIVRAVGDSGSTSSPSILTFIQPKPVENLRVVNTSAESVTVAWTQVSSPTEEVILCSQSQKRKNITCSKILSNAASYTLDDVDSCSWYNISVGVVGESGVMSPLASVQEFIEKQDFEGTIDVIELATLLRQDDSFLVHWKLGNTSCSSMLRVCYSLADNGDANETCYDLPSYEYSTELDKLELCSNYSVSIMAVLPGGQLSGWKTIIAETGPGAVKGLAVTGQVFEDGNLTVSWQPLVCALLYTVCWSEWDIEGQSELNCFNTSDSNYTLTGLQTYIEFNISVVAIHKAYKSSYTAQILAKLDVERTLELTLKELNPTSIVVAWDYSRGEGPPLHHLVACLTTEVSGHRKCMNVNAANHDLALEGLQPCSGYKLLAKAVGADGGVLEVTSLDLFTNQTGDNDFEDENKIVGFTVTNVTSNTISFKWDGLLHKQCIRKYVIDINFFGSFVGSENIPNDTYSFTSYEVTPCILITVSIYALLPNGEPTAKSEIITDTGIQVPGEVENIEVYHTTSSSIHVRWDPPSEKNDCLVRYLICWQADGSQTVNCSEQLQTIYNSYSIVGLLPCTSYNISVAATGSEKDIGNATYIVSSTGPKPVQDLKVDNQEPNTVWFEWEASECANSYSVCWGAWTGKGVYSCEYTNLTSYSLNGLRGGESYSVIVTAETDDGQLSDIAVSTWNESINSNNIFIDGFEITEVTPVSVHLKWNGLSHYITFDQYVIKVESLVSEMTINVSSKVNTFTVENLEPCIQYSFQIYAIFSNGHMTAASTVKTDTKPEAPGAVEDLEIFHTSSSSIHLQWNPPAEKNNCLLKYLVCWRTHSVEMETCTKVTHSSYNAFSITGLKPSTMYTISVAAMGSDKEVGSVTEVTWSTGSKPVRALTASEEKPQEVTLKWEAPAGAHTYLICWGAWTDMGAHSCNNTTLTHHTVSELEKEKSYSIIVEAEIEKGSFSDKSILIWNGTSVSPLTML